MWPFLLMLACRGPATDLGSPCCDAVVPEDPCEGQVCVDVCSVPFARGPGPSASGWEVDAGLDCPGEGFRTYPVASPDGTALLVDEGEEAFLYRPADGSRTPVPTPYVSPWIEGAHVYPAGGCSAEAGVYVVPDDGGTPLRVDERTPAWIAADGDRAWVVSEATQLGCDPGADFGPL